MPLASESSRGPVRTSLGLVAYCFGIARSAHGKLPDVPDFGDPIVFVEQAAAVGANAVQIGFGTPDPDTIRRLRKVAEERGILLEATVNVPKSDADVPKFEKELQSLRELGVKIARTVLFPGRRYEQFKTLEAFRAAE